MELEKGWEEEARERVHRSRESTQKTFVFWAAMIFDSSFFSLRLFSDVFFDFFRFEPGFFETGFYVTTRLIRFDAKFGGSQKKGKKPQLPEETSTWHLSPTTAANCGCRLSRDLQCNVHKQRTQNDQN